MGSSNSKSPEKTSPKAEKNPDESPEKMVESINAAVAVTPVKESDVQEENVVKTVEKPDETETTESVETPVKAKTDTVETPVKAETDPVRTPVKDETAVIVADCPPILVSEAELEEVASATKAVVEARGGRSLEIVLSPAVKPSPRSRVSPPVSPSANLSQEAIQKRLQEAQERRLSIGDMKVASLSAQLAKVQLVQGRKEEQVRERAQQIKEELQVKLNTADENRSSYLEEMKAKVSDHMSKIEKAQKELEAQIEAARQAAEASLNEKSMKSEENKNLQMECVLGKLKEHQEYVDKVRNNQEEMLKPKVEELEAKIKAKEERSKELLAQREVELREKIAEQNRKAELVRMNKEKLVSEGGANECLDLTNESA